MNVIKEKLGLVTGSNRINSIIGRINTEMENLKMGISEVVSEQEENLKQIDHLKATNERLSVDKEKANNLLSNFDILLNGKLNK